MSILHRRAAIRRRTGKTTAAPLEFPRASERDGRAHQFTRGEPVPTEFPRASSRDAAAADRREVQEAVSVTRSPKPARRRAKKKARRTRKAAAPVL